MMKLPKIRSLDLRSLEVRVAEHNAKPGALKLDIWSPSFFRHDVLSSFLSR